jgi:hypothetical protein
MMTKTYPADSLVAKLLSSHWTRHYTINKDAASEIVRQEEEIERLRKALRLIINRYDGREDDALVMRGIAREALGDE